MSRHPVRLRLPHDPRAAAAAAAGVPDPPGDTADLLGVASELAGIAQAVRDALVELARVGAASESWTGTAAEAFRDAVHRPAASRLAELPARYDGYARALRSYAAQLDGARARVRHARADAEHALARVSGSAPGSLPPAADAVLDQQCHVAAEAVRAAYNGWVDLVEACMGALRTIDRHDHLHNPHGWHVVVDGVARVANDISTITALAGLIALAVFPPAAPVLFAISTGAGQVGLAADVERRFQYDEPVTWGDLAVDALSVVPLGDTARAARGGWRAAARSGPAARVLRAGGGAVRGFWAGNVDGLRLTTSPAAVRASINVQNIVIGPWAAGLDDTAHRSSGVPTPAAVLSGPLHANWVALRDSAGLLASGSRGAGRWMRGVLR